MKTKSKLMVVINLTFYRAKISKRPPKFIILRCWKHVQALEIYLTGPHSNLVDPKLQIPRYPNDQKVTQNVDHRVHGNVGCQGAQRVNEENDKDLQRNTKIEALRNGILLVSCH